MKFRTKSYFIATDKNNVYNIHTDRKVYTGLNFYNYYEGFSIISKNFEGFSIIPKGVAHIYYGSNYFLRKVWLPMKSPGFQIKKIGLEWKANMIILSEKYSLLDTDTYKKFNLDPKLNISIINNISLCGDVESLNLWKNYGTQLFYDEIAMDLASRSGYIAVLEWWLQSGLKLKYSSNAIDYASREGHVEVLKWWLSSGLKLKYTNKSINRACYSKNSIQILDWWINSGLKIKYSNKAIDNICIYGFIELLNWWLNSGLKMKYLSYDIDRCSAIGDINILDWFHKSGLKIKYSSNALNYAIVGGHIEVIEWWIKSKLKLKYSEKGVRFIYGMNSVYYYSDVADYIDQDAAIDLVHYIDTCYI